MKRFPAVLALLLGMMPLAAQAIPTAGSPPPPLDLRSLDGKPTTLAAFKGKALYVNFFASYCGPCHVETPDIIRLNKQYASHGLQTIGVDVGEERFRAVDFVKQFAIPYPVLLDDSSTTMATWGTIVFPVHVFIGRSGKVSRYVQGEMNAKQIETAIKDALRS